MFIDVAEIELEAGRGGDGCVSMRREKYVPRGGPDGGNGGRGGSIWLEASVAVTTLLDFRYRRHYRAGRAKPGQGARKTGADGQDLVLPVPCGTTVQDVETGMDIGELVEPGQRLLVARGGRGGRGNWEFRTATRQTPRRAEEGRLGQKRRIRLELKLIADIGLIGAPNAGKSTLLAAISAARPRIADYPFTTLVPNLGIVDLGEFRSCTVADIPGLIEGASEGRGLGLEFLRHVERTRALLYLVDPGAGPVVDQLAALRSELESYGHGLPTLPFAVVLTKADVAPEPDRAAAAAAALAWAEPLGAREIVVISAVARTGLAQLLGVMARLHEESPGRLEGEPGPGTASEAGPGAAGEAGAGAAGEEGPGAASEEGSGV